MANVDKFVSVTVSQETASVSQAGFGTPMWLGQVSAAIIPTRVGTYESLVEMTDAGFATTDRAYLWAQTVAGQTPAPERWKIGRRIAGTKQVATLTITTVDVGAWTMTIDGVAYTYTADGLDTELTVAQGLLDLIAASDTNTDSNGTAVTVPTATLVAATFTVTAIVAGEDFSIAGGFTPPGGGAGTWAITTAGVASAETITAALNAVQVEDDDFYFVNIENRNEPDQLLANTWVASQAKVLVLQTSDPEVLTTTGGNTGLLLAATANKRTHLRWYHRPKDFCDGAMTGRAAAFDLDAAQGAGTWAIKQLGVVTPSKLTSAQRDGAIASGADVYISTGGRGTTVTGASVEGEFMDFQTTIDWTTSRIQEDVFAPMATTPTKIPYTDAGIAVIKAAVLGRLKIGVTNWHFSGDDPTLPSVDVPRSRDVSTADRSARNLRNVRGRAIYASAIHKVFVTVNVTV